MIKMKLYKIRFNLMYFISKHFGTKTLKLYTRIAFFPEYVKHQLFNKPIKDSSVREAVMRKIRGDK
jgi:hypothetical protein